MKSSLSISEAEANGKCEYNNWIYGLTHEQLLSEAGMNEQFVTENNITDAEIIQTLIY